MHRRLVLAALAALPARAIAQPTPAAPIAALLDGLRAGMKAGKAMPFATRAAKLAPIIDAAFDLRAILATSVGPRYATFTADQQAALFAAFRDFTIASWVANFDADGGERFELTPETRAIGADQVVTTRIVPTTGDPTRLDFVMRTTPSGWRAIDILIDGTISRTAVQRSDFRVLLKDGKPEPLTENLKTKAATLAN